MHQHQIVESEEEKKLEPAAEKVNGEGKV